MVICIIESKLYESVLEPKVHIDNFKTLQCYGESVACYMRNYLSYNIVSVFPQEIENFFFESVPPNSKPVVVRTFYCPPEKLFTSFKNSRLQ